MRSARRVGELTPRHGRVDEPVQLERGGVGEAEQHRLSPGAGKTVLRRRSKELGTVGIGEDQAGVLGKIVAGTAAWVAKKRRSQESRYSGHLRSVRKSSTPGLYLDDPVSPWPLRPTTSARGPSKRQHRRPWRSPARGAGGRRRAEPLRHAPLPAVHRWDDTEQAGHNVTLPRVSRPRKPLRTAGPPPASPALMQRQPLVGIFGPIPRRCHAP